MQDRNQNQNQHKKPATGHVSRRAFLKGSGAAVAATALTTQVSESIAQEKEANIRPAGEPRSVTLNVNGKDYKLELEPRAILLDVLRNDLNFTGCKEVDENQASGADTVLIDGKAVLASARFAVECEGQRIQTAEAFDVTDEVVQGFVKHDAMQCGFCTPGFVMAMRAFLKKKPKASLEEIQKGLGGNICRCGTYHGITQCALELAKKGGA